MRLLTVTALTAAVGLAGCDRPRGDAVSRTLDDVNAVDENGLSEIMLTAADPAEAVAYFRRTSERSPGRVDLRRGLAESLIRADRPREAVTVWREVAARPEAGPGDRVAYAGALIRNGAWEDAEAALARVPADHESFERYRLEAMIADSNEDWSRADRFYERALARASEPGDLLNNWGYSKLTRGAYGDAERLLTEALTHEPGLFTAKNNLVLARAGQQNYQLPILEASEEERARLLHTMALSAIRQGDVNIGEGLLEDAIATHPQYFEAAARSLRALRNDRRG